MTINYINEMMKSKIAVLILLLAIVGFQTNAQVVYARPGDFEEMSKRTLVVEQIVQDAGLMVKLKKRKKKGDTSYDRYLHFTTHYNEMIKNEVESNWGLNQEIEYRTTHEIDELINKESKEYVFLLYDEFQLNATYGDWDRYYRLSNRIPVLYYTKSENANSRPDYGLFLSYNGYQTDNAIHTFDIKLAIILMQNHIKQIKEESRSRYNPEDYIKEHATIDCKTLSTYRVLVDTNLFDKEIDRTILNDYPLKMILADSKTIEEYYHARDNMAHLVVIPMGPDMSKRGELTDPADFPVVYAKVLVTVSNSEPLSIISVNNNKAPNTPNLNTTDLKYYVEECKSQ